MIACQHNSSTNNRTVENVKFKFFQSVNLSNLVDEHFELLPLKSDSTYLIGSVTKVVYAADSFFIMDSYITNKVYCFDKLGQLKYSIGQTGSGPGELQSLTEMIISKKHIYLIDGSNFSLLSFLHNGKFEFEKKLNYWIYEGIPYGNKQYLVYSPTDLTFGNVKNTNVLKIVDQDFEHEITSYFPYEEGHDDVPYSGYLCTYHNTYSFSRPLYNRIYTFDKAGNLHLRYLFDFGTYNWPISMKQIAKEPDEAERLFKNGGIMSIIHNILENKDYFVFKSYMVNPDYPGEATNSTNRWICIIDKRTGKGYAINRTQNNSQETLFTYPIATKGEWFISVLPPEKINEFIKSKKSDPFTNKLRDVAGVQKHFNNPVLLFFKLKENLNF